MTHPTASNGSTAALPAAQTLAKRIKEQAEHWAHMTEIDNGDAAVRAKAKHAELLDELLALAAAQPQGGPAAPVGYVEALGLRLFQGSATNHTIAIRHAPQPGDVPIYAAQPPTQGDGSALAQMEARKDAAYLERNQVVAALAKCFPSGTARTAIDGWSEDWHGCVYIDLPTGQASWHYHDSQAYLFADLPAYRGGWDGHSTEQKYARLAALPAAPAQPPAPADPIRGLIQAHEDLIEGGENYAYFELAYTRRTGWMAWLTDRPAQGEPGTAAYTQSRKVIAQGQGDTADEACQDALDVIAEKAAAMKGATQ